MRYSKTQDFSTQNFHPVVLVVDDDKPTRTLLRYMMEEEGYQVIEACDGEAAIAAYRNFQIDLVLLDGMMPRMDGFTCCQRLNTFPIKPHVPIVMLTSLNDRESINRAFAAGATDYLTKPFNCTLLCQRVRHLLKTHCAKNELHQQTQRSDLLKTIAQFMSCTSDSQKVLSVAVAETRRLLHVDRVLIYRLNPDRSGVVCAESVNAQFESLFNKRIQDPCFANQFDQIYQLGHIRIIEDIHDSNLSPCHINFLAQFQVRASVIVPILSQNCLGGLLIVHHCTSPRCWQVWEVKLLEQLAAQLAIAI